MRKYLKAYRAIIKINVVSLFSYRFNFFNNFIITIGWGIMSIASIILLTSRASSVYGWSRNELFLLTGVYSIAIGIFHMFFSSSFERFSRTISLGELDSYLLMPIDIQFYLSVKTFRPLTIFRVLIGILFTGYMMQVLHVSINIFTLILMSVFILCGVLLLYSIWFLVIALNIWYPTLTNLVNFLYQFSNLGRYPPSVLLYTRNIIVFLFVPLTLIASVPARFILGKASVSEVVALIGITIILFFLSRKFWQFALRFYTSASG